MNLNYLPEDRINEISKKAEETKRITIGLIRYLKNKKINKT
jgi:hypothetical protein